MLHISTPIPQPLSPHAEKGEQSPSPSHWGGVGGGVNWIVKILE